MNIQKFLNNPDKRILFQIVRLRLRSLLLQPLRQYQLRTSITFFVICHCLTPRLHELGLCRNLIFKHVKSWFIDNFKVGFTVEKAMSEIAKSVGQRIRNYRTQQGLSQEKLAELSGCHPTYIGQLERGEKNATLESIDKIATALNVSLSKLFEKLGGQEDGSRDIPLECYEFLSAKTKEEQEHLYRILLEMDKYKRN